MGSATGVEIHWGTAEETVYGTPVVVDRFHEILSEGVERRPRYAESKGFRGGTTRNLRAGSKEAVLGHDAGGELTLEFATTGMGRYLKHLLGGTPTIVQQGTTTAWLQTHTLGSLSGKSLTTQKQLRDQAGAVIQAFTYPGTKILSGEFTVDRDDYLHLTLTLDSREERTNVAAAAATYTGPKLFHWGQGSVRVGGTTVGNVHTASSKLDNTLKTDSYYMGAAGLKGEPATDGDPVVDGTITAEFQDPATLYSLFRDNTGAELILEYVGDVISGAFNERLTITIPEIRLRGKTPTVGGPEVIVTDWPYVGRANAAGTAGYKIELMSTDVAI